MFRSRPALIIALPSSIKQRSVQAATRRIGPSSVSTVTGVLRFGFLLGVLATASGCDNLVRLRECQRVASTTNVALADVEALLKQSSGAADNAGPIERKKSDKEQHAEVATKASADNDDTAAPHDNHDGADAGQPRAAATPVPSRAVLERYAQLKNDLQRIQPSDPRLKSAVAAYVDMLGELNLGLKKARNEARKPRTRQVAPPREVEELMLMPSKEQAAVAKFRSACKP